MIQTNIEHRTLELDGGTQVVPVSSWAFAGVQVVPEDYSSTTGTIEIKKSISGNVADAVSFSSAISPNMTTRAIEDTIDIRDIAYLHITTTADSGKHATVYIHLSEA